MNTPSKNKMTPTQLKDESLRRTVQGFKLVNLRCNHADIALVANLSKVTIYNKSKIVDELWLQESDTPDSDKKFVLERGIELGIKDVLSSSPSTSESVFGVILGMYLKVETNLLDNATSLIKVWTTGKYIAHIYGQVIRYKKKKEGSSIHSVNNKYAKYLLQPKNVGLLNLDKLFVRTDSYQVDKYSKRWTSTDLLKQFIEISCKELLNSISDLPVYTPLDCSQALPYMLLQKDTKQEAGSTTIIDNNISMIHNTEGEPKKTFHVVDINSIYTTLVVKRDILKQFSPESQFSLLTQAYKFTKNEIHVPIKHRAKTNEQLGRTYNVFCSMHSYERSQLGYISYDMSAALQTISLQLIRATRENYPMLWKYAHDPVYKKQIRTEIAQDLKHVDADGNIDVSEVKSQLTAFAHGSTKNIKRHKHYTVFQAESDTLRKAVIKHVGENDPNILKRAIEQSKREFPEDLDWLDMDTKDTPKEVRDKASVFFFVWTWYERQIREVMLEILYKDGIEVHDCVYSQEDIDPKVLEQAIYKYTKQHFSITIEKEY